MPQTIGGSGINLSRVPSDFSGIRNAYRHPGPWNRNSRYGRYAYALPFGFYGGGPFYGDYDSFDYQGDPNAYPASGYPADDPNAQAPPDDNALSSQIAQLNDQVQDMRARMNEPQQNAPTPELQQPDAPPVPPVSVVLKTGQTLRIENYAVVGDTFWDFSSQPVRKIPLSSINVSASTKASEADGAEFPRIRNGS